MKSFLNNTNLKEINQKLPEFIQSINKTNEEVTNYINNSKINEIEINENEKEESMRENCVRANCVHDLNFFFVFSITAFLLYF